MRTKERYRVSIATPPSWSFIWNPLRDGTIGDILVAGSWPLPKEPECVRIPKGGAWVSLSEVLPPFFDYPLARRRQDYPPRPASFEVRRLGPHQVRDGCDQRRTELFRFRDAGRYLYTWVGFGPHWSPSLRRTVQDLLNSLRVQPLP